MINIKLLARLSLAFLWIFTAFTSAWFDRAAGHEILAHAQIMGSTADLCINLGSIIDLIIGLLLLFGWQLKIVCWLQIAIVIVYSILIFFIAPLYWLHPFGPVTKNIPLVVLIYWLILTEKNSVEKIL